MLKAVFLDRDGTINKDVAYLYEIDKLEWVPGALEALKWLKEQGYTLFVITNQSGVARGYFQEEDVHKLHNYMQAEIEAAGAHIEKFYYCPHLKDAPVAKYAVACDCRKPKPGMLLQCCAEYDIDKANSFMVGDSKRDVEAAEAAGIKGFLFNEENLLEFIRKIVNA